MLLVSLASLPISFCNDRVIPHFLGSNDAPWVTLLLEEYAKFAGKPKMQLERHFQTELSFHAPPYKLRLVRSVLDREWRATVVSAVTPRIARAHLFCAASDRTKNRDDLLNHVASDLEISRSELEQALFADLRAARCMEPPREVIGASDLVLRANLLLVQGLLMRSIQVEVSLRGNARPVVRHAKLHGLICTMKRGEAENDMAMQISGPLALFRRTLLYGRSLAAIVPFLSWCHHFKLNAEVLLRDGSHRFELASGAPIFPGKEPRRYDSQVEERFARDFAKAAPEWDLIREPEPVEAEGKLIFPDFALVRRAAPFDRWLLEIAGFWTPDYLTNKLRDLKNARVANLILCVDAARNCSQEELPEDARLVRYKRRVEVEQVLAILEGERL